MPRSVGSFQAFKDVSGMWRWISVTSNKFKDLEGEIFSEAAHEDYIDYVDRTQDYPELWLWHVPESRIGQADYAAYHDGFVLHSGVFEDEAVAENLSKSKGLAVSHGFRYKRGEPRGGVYGWYRTFEVSVLPAEAAGNIYTDFVTSKKEVDTMLTAEKRKFLVEHLGEERTAWLEQRLTSKGRELEEAGVAFKGLNGLLDNLPKKVERKEPSPVDPYVDQLLTGQVERR